MPRGSRLLLEKGEALAAGEKNNPTGDSPNEPKNGVGRSDVILPSRPGKVNDQSDNTLDSRDRVLFERARAKIASDIEAYDPPYPLLRQMKQREQDWVTDPDFEWGYFGENILRDEDVLQNARSMPTPIAVAGRDPQFADLLERMASNMGGVAISEIERAADSLMAEYMRSWDAVRQNASTQDYTIDQIPDEFDTRGREIVGTFKEIASRIPGRFGTAAIGNRTQVKHLQHLVKMGLLDVDVLDEPIARSFQTPTASDMRSLGVELPMHRDSLDTHQISPR